MIRSPLSTTIETTAVAVLALAAWSPARAGQACSVLPTLEHTPPWLGGTLTLRLADLEPNTAVVLLASPAAERSMTAVGRLELDRDAITVVAFGASDALGAWSLDLALPDDAALAESEAHFQALVVDPDYPGGAILTGGAHMRLIGSRLYAGWTGRETGPNGLEKGGLAIVSAIHGTTVATLDLGRPLPEPDGPGDGRPVLCPHCSIAAYVPSADELVVFDPFFGWLRGSVPLVDASRTIVLHPEGRRVFVFDAGGGGGASVHEVQLCGAVIIRSLTLPNPTPGLWVSNDEGSEAYVAEFDAGGHAALRRIDLVGLQDLGAVQVGSDTSTSFTELRYAFGRVYAGTYGTPLGEERGELTKLCYGAGQPAVQVRPMPARPEHVEPIPALDILAVSAFQSLVPAGYLWLTRPGNVQTLGGTGNPMAWVHVGDMQALGTDLWILDRARNEPPSATDPARLYLLDLTTLGWMQYPTVWHFDGALALEIVGDAYVERIALTIEGNDPPLPELEPALLLIDPAVGQASELELPLGYGPSLLHAAPVPVPVP